MGEQYHFHRHDGGRVWMGLSGGYPGPQTRAHNYLHCKRPRHRRFIIQPELRALHVLPLPQRCRVSILIFFQIITTAKKYWLIMKVSYKVCQFNFFTHRIILLTLIQTSNWLLGKVVETKQCSRYYCFVTDFTTLVAK